jgi:beta-glucosidase
MTLTFPSSIFFGTSTSAYQIETAFEHDWQGIRSLDGNLFERTTDHEKRFASDAAIIASLAPNYRMSMMWSKLQRSPYSAFDRETATGYHFLLTKLKENGVDIMMVLHHWCNPLWFVNRGGWESPESVDMFFDFGRRLVDEFGSYVSFWNTFNEPNLYATFGYVLGEFPPYAKGVPRGRSVIANMAKAHKRIGDYIRQRFSRSNVGVSHNCVYFSHENIAGMLPSRVADYWYMEYLTGFFESCDWVGLSYYAKMSFDPQPVTYLKTPEKFSEGRSHDDIWEYYPNGLAVVIERFWSKYRKPIIITENGICTSDDALRSASIRDYMMILYAMLERGIEIKGYYHWSAWDNFEWTLGPTYKFGLYECDPKTMERKRKQSADIFSRLAYKREIIVEQKEFRT